MSLRKIKINFTSSLLMVVSVAGLAGAAVLARAPHYAVSTTTSPSAVVKANQASINTPAPTPMNPSTDKPTLEAITTVRPNATQDFRSPVQAIPASPAVSEFVSVTINDATSTNTLSVHLPANADACTILKAAQAEGKISFLTIYDDPAYIASHGNSAYLYDLNGYKDNWTYSAQTASGKPIPAPGCSLTPLHGGDRVTWKYGG